eukprot:CAMPEP_0173148994 /NCGR_PEP_ID=MMETSP1105-20130129/10059_1 /TAXON_ID=2985 /ORGANISM="Ochromonas sp., Strain BG-1" /LENGTH=525 /DNA_ID=CAMNT_0014063771 /DNA_START=125 /DNA_END=1702 /DNA_ORIENTATION=-
MSISVTPKRSFSSLLGLEKDKKKKNNDIEESKEELSVNEVPELIQLTKDVIILLDKNKDNLEPIPALIHELMNFGKTFTKIDVKINEYEGMHNMTPAHLKEANSCLSLLRETLINIQTEVNQYADHQRGDKLTDKIWMTFNKSTIISHFNNFTQQVKDHCNHLLTNFLPILNTVVSNADREKVEQSIHTLNATDKDRICAMIMKEQYIMKLYLPKGSTRSGTPNPISKAASPINVPREDMIQLPKPTPVSPASRTNAATPPPAGDAENITLKKQSSASRFLIDQKVSKASVHHEASDLKEEEAPQKDEKISVIRNLSFNLFEKRSRSNSGNPTEGSKFVSAGSTAPKDDPDFDVLPDYYHIKWLSVLPQIWREFPKLTFGQIKYIYLSQNFFLYYHNDMYFVNKKTIEECYKLQRYLEGAREIACFTQDDFIFVANTIVQNSALLMKQLIPLLHQRFQGTREFTFLTLMGSELFCTNVPQSEQVLLDAVHKFPNEEAQWPVGDVNLDWTVLHAIQKKHQKVRVVL